MRLRSPWRSWAATLALLALPALVLRAGAEAEDELKCATLLAFLQNSHWPDDAVKSPLTVGVVGRAAFYSWLRTAADGKVVEGRRIRVVQIPAPAASGCCQVVYFATDRPSEIKPVLQALESSRVLAVGESDGFLEQGGAVNLFLADGHMAFEVSLGALNRAGIEISAKLLRFGQIRDLPKGRPSR